MRNWIQILIILAVTLPAISVPIEGHSITPRGIRSQAEDAQTTDEFIKRFTDERFSDVQSGSFWTLIHNYKDGKRIDVVLETIQRYFEALDKYGQGDGSLLKQMGGIKQFKDQLASWLDDSEEAVRNFAAIMLGISGDPAYAKQLGKILMRKGANRHDRIPDRGSAALAVGLLQAKEYGNDLVRLLSSKNEYDRSGAVQGLGWMGDKQHTKAVAQLLNDENEYVREAVKKALVMLGASHLIK